MTSFTTGTSHTKKKKVLIGLILLFLFIFSVLVVYHVLVSRSTVPLPPGDTGPIFGIDSGARTDLTEDDLTWVEMTNVALGDGPDVTFSVNRSSVSSGESVVLSWTSEDAVSCLSAGDGNSWFFTGNSTAGNTTTSPINEDRAFRLVCMDEEGGATLRMVYVAIAKPPLTGGGILGTIPWTPPSWTSPFGGAWGDGEQTPPGQGTGAGQQIPTTPPTFTAPPTVQVTVSPSTVPAGEKATITWTSTNATSCSLEGTGVVPAKDLPTSGTEETITLTTTYGTSISKRYSITMACSSDRGTSSPRTVYATVPGEQRPAVFIWPEGDMTAFAESEITLNWYAARADNCTASGSWSGRKAVGGDENSPNRETIRVSRLGTHTFTLTCTGPGGTNSFPYTTIYNPGLANVSLDVYGDVGRCGGTYFVPITGVVSGVRWSVKEATAICTWTSGFSGEVSSMSGSRSFRVGDVAGTHSYRLSCRNDVGTQTASVRIQSFLDLPGATFELAKCAAKKLF